MKSAKLVEPTLIVKLDLMIGPFVDVRKITLETPSKDAEENVIAVETVLPNKNVFNSNVWLLVVKEVINRVSKKPQYVELVPNLFLTGNITVRFGLWFWFQC